MAALPAHAYAARPCPPDYDDVPEEVEVAAYAEEFGAVTDGEPVGPDGVAYDPSGRPDPSWPY